MEQAASEEIASALADGLKETGVFKQDLELMSPSVVSLVATAFF